MTQITEKIEYWSANLKLLEGMDRFQYIIEQARMAKPLNEKYRIKEFQIHGCASKLWVVQRDKSCHKGRCKKIRYNRNIDATKAKRTQQHDPNNSKVCR